MSNRRKDSTDLPGTRGLREETLPALCCELTASQVALVVKNLPANTRDGMREHYFYHLHFRDEKVEAQRGKTTCPVAHGEAELTGLPDREWERSVVLGKLQ